MNPASNRNGRGGVEPDKLHAKIHFIVCRVEVPVKTLLVYGSKDAVFTQIDTAPFPLRHNSCEGCIVLICRRHHQCKAVLSSSKTSPRPLGFHPTHSAQSFPSRYSFGDNLSHRCRFRQQCFAHSRKLLASLHLGILQEVLSHEMICCTASSGKVPSAM